jgi:hypothetical protein
MDDWLVKQVMFLGHPFENWLVVLFMLMLIAALINVSEKN